MHIPRRKIKEKKGNENEKQVSTTTELCSVDSENNEMVHMVLQRNLSVAHFLRPSFFAANLIGGKRKKGTMIKAEKMYNNKV
uniref:Uncharacterized protein n=1 Tax=Setaria italica TaxID=4555 RepID=K3YBA6_SETIT